MNGLRLSFDVIDAQSGQLVQKLGAERMYQRDTTHLLHAAGRVASLAGREVVIRPNVSGIQKGRRDFSYSLINVHKIITDSGKPTKPAISRSEEPALVVLPTHYGLHPSYPNPFNPSTQLNFDLPENSNISLVVYDMLGRKVTELVSGLKEAGYHSATWNASTVASGAYFARFTATDASGIVKLNRVSKLLLTK